MADVIIDWSDKALRDLRQIKRFYVKHSDELNAIRRIEQLIQEVEKLAANPFLGKIDPDLQECQYWYVLETNYRIYYDRTGPTSITVYRVWPSRAKPLKPDQIK